MRVASMPMVRRAEPHDLDRLAELFDQYRQFYARPADLALARAFLQQRMARGESILLAASASARVEGFVQLYPTFCSVAAGPLLILYDLYVEPAARRGGLARALLSAARDAGRARGAVRLELATAISNGAAQALYESM